MQIRYKTFFEKLDFTGKYIVIASYNHELDEKILKHVVNESSKAHYIAMVASERKSIGILGSLEKEGCDPIKLKGVFSPAGLKIGGVRPSDIALSIVAQIVEQKEKRVNGCRKA